MKRHELMEAERKCRKKGRNAGGDDLMSAESRRGSSLLQER